MKRYSICAQDTNKTAEWTVILSVREILTKEAINPKCAQDANETIAWERDLRVREILTKQLNSINSFFQASFLQLHLSCEDYCVPCFYYWLHFTVVATYSNLMNITWFKRCYCKWSFLEVHQNFEPLGCKLLRHQQQFNTIFQRGRGIQRKECPKIFQFVICRLFVTLLGWRCMCGVSWNNGSL